MDQKIQELTEKIYQEGVEKGKAEAERIIEEARQQEKQILKNAQEQADSILEKARKQAVELDENTKSELKLFARQSVDALKSEITNLITGNIAEKAVKTALSDKEFMQKLILNIAQQFAEGDCIIQTTDAESLQAYIAKNAQELMNTKIKIEQVNHIKTNFVLMPGDRSYKINFGEEEFVNYFKDFLRPQLINMLF